MNQKKHRKQRNFDDMEDDREVPGLQTVSFVDDRPQAFLLALHVRRPPSADWMVEDPFGHGEAPDLRVRLEERLDRQPGLRKWLAPLMDSDSTSPTLGQLFEEGAKWKVEERLTLAITQHEPVHERLVAMQRALLEAESAKIKGPPSSWREAQARPHWHIHARSANGAGGV